MLDPEGRVSTWNSGAERIKGYTAPEIIGQHFSRFYPVEDLRAGKPEMELKFAAEQGRIEDEGWRLRKDGSRFWANVTITALREHSGKLIGFAKVTRDVTERMRAAQQLRDSEERYRTVAETATDAIVGINEHSLIQFVNPAATKIFGFEAVELIGQPLTKLMPERFRHKHLKRLQSYTRTGVRHLNWSGTELAGQRKSGEEFPVEVSFGEVRSGERRTFIGFIRDITERKNAERRLSDSEKSLRELSLHLLRTQDEERRRLGRELHDSLGQYLAAVKMRLDGVAASLGSLDPALSKQIAECSRLTDDCIKEVRTISYLMYPPMLEEMGLKSAIPWYVDGFTQRSGIRTRLDLSPDFDRLPRDAELAMFRVLQESLTNVHRHSGSLEAQVRLFVCDGMAVQEVQDYGKGIDGGGFEAGTQFGVGLRGMRERLRQLGGNLEIFSTQDGTTVVATVPCGARRQADD
jgi:PAS domain S-box-containing protein